MISVRKKNILLKVFAGLPAAAILIVGVFLSYNRMVTWIEDDANLVILMTGELAAQQLKISKAPEFAGKRKFRSPDGTAQIAGFIPVRQKGIRFQDPAAKGSAGRFFFGFPAEGLLSPGLLYVIFGVPVFFLKQRCMRGCRAGNAARLSRRRFFPFKNRTEPDVSAMSAKEDVLVEEDKTLASVNSEGSTFSVFWRRCRDLRSSGARESGRASAMEYTDPFILFLRTNSDASTDIMRIIGRLEKENGYLDALKTYTFRTALLIRDLGFQLPPGKKIGSDPLVETILDYYAITVHGIGQESKAIAAFETAKQAEELEAAARKGDLAFLTENTPVFLEYMEYFITGIVKLTEEKNIFNDRRLHAKHRISDLSRRFGKRSGKKSG
ncbi:MAG: hypothetical protein LBP69_09100 [Treponema sp.]|jgi:hypothetical protein|nr:hypothetical protein [Treponema sp.]